MPQPADSGVPTRIQGTTESPASLPGGSMHVPRSRARRVVDIVAAGALLLLASPLLLTALGIVWVVDGRPLLYRGRRMGRHGQPFTIYKIRTLQTDAEQRLGGTLLSDSHDHRTRTGSFWRDTRLDELPQLWLVLTGKMALFGPRPERPEVYAEKCRDIPGYADRFLVLPGVFGYSQILTPHGTPKRVRAVIDRGFVQGKHPLRLDLALLGLTLFSLVRETGARVARFFSNRWNQIVLRSYREKRRLRRMRPWRPARVVVGEERLGQGSEVLDVTAESFLARGHQVTAIQQGSKVTLLIGEEQSPVRHRARVRVTKSSLRPPRLERQNGEADLADVVVHYEPWSENSQYFIEQYLLRKSIVRLPRRLRKMAFDGTSPSH